MMRKELYDELCEVFGIEKGLRTVIVPPANGRKGYQYQRNFPDNKRENKAKNKRIDDGIYTKFNNRIKLNEVKNLAVCTDYDFSIYIDCMIQKKYKGIPSIIRLPNLNGKLAQKLHLANVCFYMEKNRFNHINPERKKNYNQDFRVEEYKRIPFIIRNAKAALYDSKLKNFILVELDKKDRNKVNAIAFNKDVNGNYLVTVGKKNIGSFGGKYKAVGVGVAPTIHAIQKSHPTARLLASPTAYTFRIAETAEKSSLLNTERFDDYVEKSIHILRECGAI